MFPNFKTPTGIQSYKWKQQNILANLYHSIFLICYLKSRSDVLLAYLLTYFQMHQGTLETNPSCNKSQFQPPKLHTSHPLIFHQLYLVYFKFRILYLPGGSPLSSVTPSSTPCHQKSPNRLSTSYLLWPYMVNFKLPLYFPGGGGAWWWW